MEVIQSQATETHIYAKPSPIKRLNFKQKHHNAVFSMAQPSEQRDRIKQIKLFTLANHFQYLTKIIRFGIRILYYFILAAKLVTINLFL